MTEAVRRRTAAVLSGRKKVVLSGSDRTAENKELQERLLSVILFSHYI